MTVWSDFSVVSIFRTFVDGDGVTTGANYEVHDTFWKQPQQGAKVSLPVDQV